MARPVQGGPLSDLTRSENENADSREGRAENHKQHEHSFTSESPAPKGTAPERGKVYHRVRDAPTSEQGKPYCVLPLSTQLAPPRRSAP